VPLAFVLALLLAWITARTDARLTGMIEIAALIPFITTPPIGAVARSLLAAPRSGVINVFARTLDATVPVLSIYMLGGPMFVMSLYPSPYVFVMMKAVISRMDARLEHASLISVAQNHLALWCFPLACRRFCLPASPC
jgi:iron(III) transport system permease protein